MGDAVELVLSAARDCGLLSRGRPVVVMLSGGRDSTCLLDVVWRLASGSGATVCALHVNHGLRRDADGDEQHCIDMCARLGVELSVARAPERPAKGNLQAWAREFRYEAGFAQAADRGALLAVAHTASDQAETILYRLASSPGRRALLGMPARRGDLVRPLLTVTREQTTEYCRARGLAWRDDATNESESFARARVRHGLLPALRAVHPAAEANVLRTARMLAAEAQVLDRLVSETLGVERSIALERLAALPPALAGLVLTRLAELEAPAVASVTGTATAPAVAHRLPELLALRGVGGSRAIDVGGGIRALVEYGVLRFEACAGGDVAVDPQQVALPVPGRVRFGAWEIECATIGAGEIAAGEMGTHEIGAGEISAREPDAAGAERAVLDLSACGPSLTVRRWRAGDRMRPLGLGGSKSLADLFGDRRVARERRHTLPLIGSASEILWVPGVAVAEAARIGAHSERAAELIARRL